jgi:hypothetical protein
MSRPAVDTEQVKLLFAPYHPPALCKGARAWCLYRGCVVVVTSWTGTRISWPRCRLLEGGGHPSLLVNEELARAIEQFRRVLAALSPADLRQVGLG